MDGDVDDRVESDDGPAKRARFTGSDVGGQQRDAVRPADVDGDLSGDGDDVVTRAVRERV